MVTTSATTLVLCGGSVKQLATCTGIPLRGMWPILLTQNCSFPPRSVRPTSSTPLRNEVANKTFSPEIVVNHRIDGPILASGRNVHHAAARENGGCRKAMSSGDEGLTGKGRHVPRRSLCRRSPGTTATQAKNWQTSSATEYRRSVILQDQPVRQDGTVLLSKTRPKPRR